MSGVPLTSESPYRVLLRQPQVRWQAVNGLLVQVTQGASGVGIILVIRQHAGSVALAGGVVGALYVAAGLAGPLQGRLIDRRGAAGVVAATGAGHAAALAAIVLLAGARAGSGAGDARCRCRDISTADLHCDAGRLGRAARGRRSHGGL